MNQPLQQTALKVHSISKAFSSVNAVNNISFEVERGDVFAFLGPNGAGKTTTLRMLLDIIQTDSGHIEWNLNGKPNTVAAAEHIGYLPEERGLYLDIPIIKSLVHLASIRGMEASKAKKMAMEWLEKLELADRAKEKLQVLSKGNQQKIQFVASILHQPLFVILDEPFSGLDPLNQEKFIGFIKEINNQGTTILISAHQMALVEKIATKVLLINKGSALYNGSLSGIYTAFGKNNIIELQLDARVDETVFHQLTGIENITLIDDWHIKLTFKQQTDLKKIMSELIPIEGITDITSHKADLHEIFLQLVKKHGL